MTTQVQVDVSTCQHRWQIDQASGPESQGTCSLCGETRTFKNWIEFDSWEKTNTINLTRLGQRYRSEALALEPESEAV
jgi:hypothetical protein